MNLYKLDSKKLDEAFLRGEVVTCIAVVTLTDRKSIEQSYRIVIQLTNGKKYLGLITGVDLVQKGKLFVGHFSVRKSK